MLMKVLELRSKSLSSPVDLIDVFTTHVQDRHLSRHGICLRTFTKDWAHSDGRDRGSFERSAGEYVWTYTFADDEALPSFIAYDSKTRIISSALRDGLVRECDVNDKVLESPVILLSAPRAGSTLLYELLTRASALWSIRDESHHVLEAPPAHRPETRGYGSHALTAEDADPTTAAALRSAFLIHMRDHAGRRYIDNPRERVRFVEKTPRNAFRIPFLDALFPDAQFVFLLRDPVESISSMMELWENKDFHRSINLPGWSGPKGFRWCMALPPGWRELAGRSTAEIAAFQWKACNEAIMDGLEALPGTRWCTLNYADLLKDTQAQISRLCAFANIPFDEGLAQLVSGTLPHSSRVISPPSGDKVRRNRAAIEPVLPTLQATIERAARLCG
jgi:hypothetical protein